MRPTRLHGLVALAATALIAACSTGAAPTSQPGTGGGGGGAPATQPPGGGSGGSGGSGGLPASACGLLSGTEIQGIVGAPVKAGVEQDSDGQVSCNWDGSTDSSPALGVTVAEYNDAVWQAGSASANSKPVSGLGDAAYQGWPTAGALSIKVKGLMVTIGVVSFTLNSAVVSADDVSLAKLVLSRL